MKASFKSGSGVLDAKQTLLAQAAKLGRWLGVGPASSASKRPNLQHPIAKLVYQDGLLMLVEPGDPAAPYMDLFPIRIDRKHSLQEVGGEFCRYRFELNQVPDRFWAFFFRRTGLDSARVQFEGRLLVLTCRPAELENEYQQVKTAIAQADAWYSVERERLARAVIEAMERRQVEKELEQNRKDGLRRQFHFLQL